MDKLNSIYEKLIESKTGDLIPLTISGKTLESRYNPLNDALRTLSTVNINTDFLLILGISSGLLIKEILKQKPEIFILALENSENDIDLLRSSPVIKELESLPNCKFTSLENLKKNLFNFFQPVFFNSFSVFEQKNWIIENENKRNDIQKIIKNTLDEISKDYSVQAHFGKIWMHNFFSNLKNISILNSTYKIDTSKTAVILAAGPSFDKNINLIVDNREKYFLIATDTSFEAMNKRNIKVDAVISLDGQTISANHFFNIIHKDTIFIFDICGNSSAVNKIVKTNKNIIFFNSGHPLSTLLQQYYSDILLNLTSGSGTVTMAALDFAVKIGFNNIQILGADFGYIENKPYKKGTYLDNLYNLNSSKIESSEKSFSKLLYRVPLIWTSQDKATTDVLKSYESSLLNYFNNMNLKYKYENYIYNIINPVKKDFKIILNNEKFSYSNWINKLISTLESHNILKIQDLLIEDYSILPLMSYIKNHDNNTIEDVSNLRKKAIDLIKRYK